MKLYIMSVRDRAADTFGQPYCVTHLGSATRGFMDEVNRVDPQNMLNKHPEDFDLYHLGFYMDDNASFELLKDGPRQIAIGKDCVVPR